MEEWLPVRVYGDEWDRLNPDPVRSSLRRDAFRLWLARYWELGEVERTVPWVLALMYAAEIARQLVDRQVPADLLPGGDTRALFRLYAVLALAKGRAVEAADADNAWAAWMQERDPDHRSLKPFEELDPETQASDEPFAEAIRAVAARLEVRPSGLASVENDLVRYDDR